MKEGNGTKGAVDDDNLPDNNHGRRRKRERIFSSVHLRVCLFVNFSLIFAATYEKLTFPFQKLYLQRLKPRKIIQYNNFI